MAIDINELKFNKNDLKFFKKQLAHQTPVLTAKEIDIIDKLLIIIDVEPRTSTIIIKHLENMGYIISGEKLRKLIALIRRYPKLDFDSTERFITATTKGYRFSYIDIPQGRKEIISYFQKTQTRWKLTFSELYNLMELLNQFPDEKTKQKK